MTIAATAAKRIISSRWREWVAANPDKYAIVNQRRRLRYSARSPKGSNINIAHIHFPLTQNWHTVEYVADYLNKHPTTICIWCETGFLIECGYRVMKIDSGSSRRWWIYIPPEQDKPLEPPDIIPVAQVANPQQLGTNIDTLAL